MAKRWDNLDKDAFLSFLLANDSEISTSGWRGELSIWGKCAVHIGIRNISSNRKWLYTVFRKNYRNITDGAHPIGASAANGNAVSGDDMQVTEMSSMVPKGEKCIRNKIAPKGRTGPNCTYVDRMQPPDVTPLDISTIDQNLHFGRGVFSTSCRVPKAQGRPQPLSEIVNPDETLFCKCEQPNNQLLAYIQCEECLEWFHFHCVGERESQLVGKEEMWLCSDCKAIDLAFLVLGASSEATNEERLPRTSSPVPLSMYFDRYVTIQQDNRLHSVMLPIGGKVNSNSTIGNIGTCGPKTPDQVNKEADSVNSCEFLGEEGRNTVCCENSTEEEISHIF